MQENFVITGEGEKRGHSMETLILWKKKQKFWNANGEIDFYTVRDIQSGIAHALTHNEWEQKLNLGDLKKPSSPLGYLPTRHDIIKGSLRVISEEELGRILQVQ